MLDSMSFDKKVAAIAETQHGMFTRTQVRGLGGTDDMIEYRIDTGRWVPRSREALMLAGTPHSFRRELLAAALSIPDAVAAEDPAAQLWGMRGLRRDRVLIMVPRGSNHRLDFATVRETSTPVSTTQRRVVDGIPVTSRERTVCDIAKRLGPERLGWLIGQQVNDGNLRIEDLYQVFYGWARRGRRGVRKLRAVLEAFEPGLAVPESELEERTLLLIRSSGLPEPVLQFKLTFWQGYVGRFDFVYPDARLIVEVDGRRWHGPETFENDRRRDNAANLAGWDVLRFTWRMVVDNPDYVVDSIREGIRVGRAAPTGGTIPV